MPDLPQGRTLDDDDDDIYIYIYIYIYIILYYIIYIYIIPANFHVFYMSFAYF